VRRTCWAAADVDAEHCLAAAALGRLPQVCCEGHVANAADGVYDDHRRFVGPLRLPKARPLKTHSRLSLMQVANVSWGRAGASKIPTQTESNPNRDPRCGRKIVQDDCHGGVALLRPGGEVRQPALLHAHSAGWRLGGSLLSGLA
jgi:hypothetical protein